MVICVSDKKKKKSIWLLPNAPLSNFFWKSKDHGARNKKMRTWQDALELSSILPEERRFAMNDEHFSSQRINECIDHLEHDLISFQSLMIIQWRNVTSNHCYAVKGNLTFCIDYYILVKKKIVYFWEVENGNFQRKVMLVLKKIFWRTSVQRIWYFY